MALIICPECSKHIADKSVACMGCGFPLNKTIENKAFGNIWIERRSVDHSKFRAFKIFIDGSEKAEVNDGQLLKLPIGIGSHQMFLKIDWVRSDIFEFVIDENQKVCFLTEIEQISLFKIKLNLKRIE